MINWKLQILWLVILYMMFSCSTSNAITRIQHEIKEHGTILVIDSEKGSKVEVVRSRVDSLNEAKTVQINDYFATLQSQYPAMTEFIYVHYYPGKDRCNSTGLATRKSIGQKNLRFNEKIKENEKITSIFLYKDADGINRYDKNRNWQKDKEGLLGDYFFNYHFPCSSYLILHKSGKYYVYYGESWMGKQLKDIRLFQEFIRYTQ